jgi:hypothetical protein
MSKKPYAVFWSKAYYATGTVIVHADDAEAAHDAVYDSMGDYEGSMQYCPDDDDVDVQEVTESAVKKYYKDDPIINV